MGLTFISGRVSSGDESIESVQFLVDSGATYSLLPTDVWQKLSIKPIREFQCILADGTRIERAVGECRMELGGSECTTPVLLGEPGDEPLLGVVTLEQLGLMLDPLKRILFPMKVRI